MDVSRGGGSKTRIICESIFCKNTTIQMIGSKNAMVLPEFRTNLIAIFESEKKINVLPVITNDNPLESNIIFCNKIHIDEVRNGTIDIFHLIAPMSTKQLESIIIKTYYSFLKNIESRFYIKKNDFNIFQEKLDSLALIYELTR